MTTEITAIIAEDTVAGNAQSLLCAGERTSHIQVAQECLTQRRVQIK
jgi:hypothetical protein